MDKSQRPDLLACIAAEQPALTPKLRVIARLALDDTEAFIRNTSREICAALNTSEPTLIRFCRHFGYSGLSDFRIDLALALAHAPRRPGLIEPLAYDRRRVNMAAKKLIGKRAAELVDGDRSVLVDNGSTAEFFAAALDRAGPLTIMTTGLTVASNALKHEKHDVVLTGGRIRPNALSLTGRLVETALGEMTFDTFAMGADSVDPARGCSTFREDEAHQTRAMIAAAARVIVLADRTKFSKPALHKICDMSRVDLCVTDLPEAAPEVAHLRQQGIEVHLVRGQAEESEGRSRESTAVPEQAELTGNL